LKAEAPLGHAFYIFSTLKGYRHWKKPSCNDLFQLEVTHSVNSSRIPQISQCLI